MRKTIRHRGAVLIVVLGVLVVLALMATSFAALQQIERSIAKNYLDEVRARLAAQAGVEYAAARVMLPFEQGSVVDPSMTYWGGNLTEKGTNDWQTPLERAKNPSYAWEDEAAQDPMDANVKPLLIKLDGTDMGFSGTTEGGTYGSHGDLYRLRVSDANSMIHLNDGVENGPTGNVSENLARILDNLCQVLGIPKRGKDLVNQRPLTGYRSKRDLLKFFSPAEYEKIRHHVSIGAWQDASVVNPVPLTSRAAARLYPVKYNRQIGFYRYGRNSNSRGEPIALDLEMATTDREVRRPAIAVMAMDELNAQWIERCRRAPINLNLASREVLLSLVMGLQGFYVDERRRDNPVSYWKSGPWEVTAYSFAYQTRYDLSPNPPVHGDEYGFLYGTYPLNYTAGTGAGGGVANKVVEEMIACRTGQPSKNIRINGQALDYSKVWYGGPFKNWRQFNAFCDQLVTGRVLIDPRRGMQMDYQTGHSVGQAYWHFTGSNSLAPSGVQALVAAQAMADVLKANFNPNCTLNELNPDANLYTLVDKTDLIVNSTEFCFTPMGNFEVESEGIVARPLDAGKDLFQVRAGGIVARKKIECVLKAFTAVRHTTQADFFEGRLGERGPGSLTTNTNRALELGPEPYNGPASRDCRWSGWIQLSTHGGHWKTPAESHAPGATVKTPVGGRVGQAVMHGHFSLDHRLHHHVDNAEDPIEGANPVTGKGYKFENYPDRTEQTSKLRGPYGPTMGAPGQYRLARDYTLTGIPGTPDVGTSISSGYMAVSDLRIDGAYVEQGSCAMYKNDLSTMGDPGTVSYWVKPSFHPELATRPRTFFSITAPTEVEYNPGEAMKQWGTRGSITYQRILGQWFLGSHGQPVYELNPAWDNFVYARGPWHSGSMVAGFETPSHYGEQPGPWGGGNTTWPGGGVGFVTNSLNHKYHTHAKRPDLFRDHRWHHIIMHWKFPETWAASFGQSGTQLTFMINGKGRAQKNGKTPNEPKPWMFPVNVHPCKFKVQNWFIGENKQGHIENPVRLGEVASYNLRNWPADATIDEFYMWKGEETSKALQHFNDGRYLCPIPGREGLFTSKAIRFDTLIGGDRDLPMYSGGQTVPGGSAPKGPVPVRILGAAWTWYAEEVADPLNGVGVGSLAAGTPIIRDYNSDRFLKAEVEMALLVNDMKRTLPLKNDGLTPVSDLIFSEGDKFTYELTFRVTSAGAGAPPGIDISLLATPVVDDVTLYYTQGLQFVSYECNEVAL